jgi:hypothetical protein
MRTIRFVAVLAVLLASAAVGLVMTRNGPQFPASWPEELKPYSAQATLQQVATGTQEDVYEIPFTSPAEFEKAWPYLLKLKSKGAPLILESSPSTFAAGSPMSAGVKVLWPAAVTTEGLTAGPPWPESVLSASGELPEYVVAQNGKRAPLSETNGGGFHFRARVDIVLVVDGKIVDLNRIKLPADTPIVDHRKLAE